MQKSMSLKYEPALEPLHISVKQLLAQESCVWGDEVSGCEFEVQGLGIKDQGLGLRVEG